MSETAGTTPSTPRTPTTALTGAGVPEGATSRALATPESEQAVQPRAGRVVARGGAVQRTPAEIERDIEATRIRLAGTVDALTTRVAPKNLAREAGEKARLQVVDEHGRPRTQRLALVGGVVAALVALSIWRRRRDHAASAARGARGRR